MARYIPHASHCIEHLGALGDMQCMERVTSIPSITLFKARYSPSVSSMVHLLRLSAPHQLLFSKTSELALFEA